MSKEMFDLKKTLIEAIKSKEVVEPNIPVAIALQESEDLFYWATDDKNALAEAGLDLTLLADLPLRTGALRYAQSEWQKEYRSIEQAQKDWANKAPAAFDLRDELVHHFLHAFFSHPDLYAKTQKIAQGNGNADLIQDLSDLAVLGKANAEPLRKIKMEMALLDKAEKLSAELPDMLAKANGQRLSDNKTKIIRDKAFTYMKQAVDEIRRNGQYKFWRNEARKKGYISQYVKQLNRVQKESKPVVN